uniref:Short-chain dehydrogenase n=1 Tax=Bionectria ochroleuca TaxID=29856 RepID=A0A8H7TQT8_BIOOC
MSQYTPETTGEQVAADCQAQIKNKTVLITGASPGGLGANFAKVIAKHEPASILLATRDLNKAEITAKEISELSQVRAAADEINSLNEKIDVIVNNAGIMAPAHSKTVDGIESQFGTNHIGPFLFTNLLLSKQLGVSSSGKLRIVNISSNGYRLSPIRFEDWNFDDGKTYNRWAAYGQSKTANMLFSRSLAQKLGNRGVTSVSVHPGISQTPLSKDLKMEDFMEIGPIDRAQGHASHWGHNVQYKTPSQAVATHVFAAFHPSLDAPEHNGAYVAESKPQSDTTVHCWGRDAIDAERLWALSEGIIGQKFDY